MIIRDSETKKHWKQPPLPSPDYWPRRYADPNRKLQKRYDPAVWWEIEDPKRRVPRWALVPVVHPSAWGGDEMYCKSRKLVDAARASFERLN